VRVLIALGGNALLRRGEPLEPERQQRNVRHAARSLAEVARAHELVVTHGNGPQVGLLALQAAALEGAPSWPLDVLGAETEGMIGYWIELELRNHLPGREIATLLTQVEVEADDPAFARPEKPIGPLYAREEAQRLAADHGWRVAADGGGFRRVVPSPEPRRILELASIRRLLETGVVVVCAGGGGIPVASDASGCHRGVEAVIDKDLAAALLAAELGCDALLLLTDVDAVYEGWGAPGARPLGAAAPAALRARVFEPGTMAPKVEAACRFAAGGRGFAAIGRLEDAASILAGRAGTRVADALG
jgi:carbamate kinase